MRLMQLEECNANVKELLVYYPGVISDFLVDIIKYSIKYELNISIDTPLHSLYKIRPGFPEKLILTKSGITLASCVEVHNADVSRRALKHLKLIAAKNENCPYGSGLGDVKRDDIRVILSSFESEPVKFNKTVISYAMINDDCWRVGRLVRGSPMNSVPIAKTKWPLAIVEIMNKFCDIVYPFNDRIIGESSDWISVKEIDEIINLIKLINETIEKDKCSLM